MSKKRKNEIDAWTVAVGNLPTLPLALTPKRVKMALEIIKEQEGLLGVQPCYPDGTLLLFRSKNEAIRAKNNLTANKIATGNNICHCFVDKRFLGEEEC